MYIKSEEICDVLKTIFEGLDAKDHIDSFLATMNSNYKTVTAELKAHLDQISQLQKNDVRKNFLC